MAHKKYTVDPVMLEQKYLREGLSDREIGEFFGCKEWVIRQRRLKLGIAGRAGSERNKGKKKRGRKIKFSEQQVRELTDQNLSDKEVALSLDASVSYIRTLRLKYKIRTDVRLCRRRHLPTKEILNILVNIDRLTEKEIGERYGVTEDAIAHHKQVEGIKTHKIDVITGHLAGKSDNEIAQMYRISSERVKRIRHDDNIFLAGEERPKKIALEAEQLRKLILVDKLTNTEIALSLNCAVATIADKQCKWGIRRPKRETPQSADKYYVQRRMRLKQNGGSHTKAEWQALKNLYDFRCAYCHQYTTFKLSRDHVIPVVRGGRDDIANIVPACMKCNLRKHASIWVPSSPEVVRAHVTPKV